MNVFKLALKVAARHWNYLLIYMVALGAMSLLGSGAIEVAPQGEFKADSPKVAVIDRDGTDVSAALAAFALKDAEEVRVDDSTFGLQDASAKDLASYVLIIPEGFQADLLAAARTGGDAPELQTVISYQGARGALVDQRVREFAQSLYGFAASDATASAADVARNADKACANETPVGFLAVDSQGLSAKYVNYAAFSAYALFAASSIFIAVGLSSLRRGALRRRLVLGPVPSGRYGLQVGLACALFSVAIWVVIAAAGLVAFNPLGQGAPLAAVCVVLAAQLGFALVGCAAGFLMWQLGASDTMANGAGNIFGLVCSFFSGAWIPLSVMGESTRLAAAFTPFYWATDAMTQVSEAADVTASLALQAFGEVGVTFVWAAVIALVAVALGRARLRESGA